VKNISTREIAWPEFVPFEAIGNHFAFPVCKLNG